MYYPTGNPGAHPRGWRGGEAGPGKNDWQCLAREMVTHPPGFVLSTLPRWAEGLLASRQVMGILDLVI